MSDAKYFQRGKIQELRAELQNDKTVKGLKKRDVLKKIVANMTMGNDMSQLFPDVLNCMNLGDVDVKKMVYLYLINYARAKPDLAMMAINSLLKDVDHFNPLVRALSIRTMGYIQVDKIQDSFCDPLRKCIKDADPYVRKTAAICIAKLYAFDSALCIKEGFLDSLKEMMTDANATVVANAVCAIKEIADSCNQIDLTLSLSQASKLITALSECSEWGQTYILELLMFLVPPTPEDAEMICERLLPKLQHANSAVSLTAVCVIMSMLNYVIKPEVITVYCKKLSSPLVTLFSSGPEIQFTALRSISLIVQKRPEVLKGDIKVFFCKYNDPIYVKLAKLEIIMRLVREENVGQVLIELKEYASEVDIDFVRRAVRSIGRCAIKLESMADKAISSLIELIKTKVSYVVQEAIVVVRDIFRKYPGRYEQLISTLCDYLDSLDEPEAKAAMIWIIGHYADRIDAATELLDSFLQVIKEGPAEVQLALLTAIVKLTIRRPTEGTPLFSKLINYCVNENDNPDLRDRAFIYYRLLTNNPQTASIILFAEHPSISTETDNTPPYLLDELVLHVGALASIVHKPPSAMLTETKQYNAAVLAGRIANTSASTQQAASAAYTLYNPYGNDAAPISNNKMLGNNIIDLDIGEQQDEYDAPFGATQNGSVGSHMSSPSSPSSIYAPQLPNLYDPSLSMYDNTSRANVVSPPISFQSLGSSTGAPSMMDASLLGYQSAHNNAPAFPPQSQQYQQNAGIIAQLADLNLGGGTGVDGLNNLFGRPSPAMPVASVVSPKSMWLNAQVGRGLEISGTFSRRHEQIYMDMTFANRSLTVLDNFAFAINKNTFSLTMAEPLAIQTLPKNGVVDTSLRLKCEGIPNMYSPVNLIQTCVRTNAGQPVFELLVPLHVLFTEQGNIEKNDFLRLWRDISDDKASQHIVTNTSPQLNSLESYKARLHGNNVFMVADRNINDQLVLYCSTQLPDRTMFLTELRPALNTRQCIIVWKTYATHLNSLFTASLETVLA